jgi:hypothetical protein
VDVDNYVKTGSKFLTHNKPEFLSDLGELSLLVVS